MKLPRLLDGRLKLRHLLLVDALATQRTLVGAAAALHVTQPVITRSLRELETIIGVELYDRGPRGVTPTVFGEAFAEHARAVLAQLNLAARHVVELADAERGTVTVGMHLAGSNVLLPEAIALLKSQRPQLTVVVREGLPDTLLVELESGRIDLIVGRLSAPTDGAAVREPLYDESVQLVVGAHHPITRQRAISFDDLAEYPWILPGTETALRRELEEVFARNEIPLPVNRIETTVYLTVRQLLLETDVVAVLPSLIVHNDPRLVVVPLPLDPISHSVGMTLPAGRALSPSAEAMATSLRTVARMMTDRNL